MKKFDCYSITLLGEVCFKFYITDFKGKDVCVKVFQQDADRKIFYKVLQNFADEDTFTYLKSCDTASEAEEFCTYINNQTFLNDV